MCTNTTYQIRNDKDDAYNCGGDGIPVAMDGAAVAGGVNDDEVPDLHDDLGPVHDEMLPLFGFLLCEHHAAQRVTMAYPILVHSSILSCLNSSRYCDCL